MSGRAHGVRWLPIVLLAGGAWMARAAEPAGREDARVDELLRHDCGSCHGLRLTGGLGPALTPQALAGRSADELRATILDGRPGTAMPPWRGLIGASAVDRIVRRLRGEGDDAP